MLNCYVFLFPYTNLLQVVRQTLPAMETLGICGEAGCWIWPSITLNTYQTAEILAGSLGVGRSRIVPE